MRCIAVLFVAAVLFGCGGGKDISGTWTGRLKARDGEFTFNKGGKVEVMVAIPENEGLPPFSIKLDGTYKLEGDTLSMTLESVELKDFPKEFEAAKEPLAQAFSKSLGVGTETTGKVEFKGADSFVLTGSDGEKRTYTRKK